MASRRLKFKPKPLVGSSVRRAREKEDLPEPSSSLSDQTSQVVENSIQSSDLLKDTYSASRVNKSEPTAIELTAAAQLLNLSSTNNFILNPKNKNDTCNETLTDNITIESSNYSSLEQISVDCKPETISQNLFNKPTSPNQYINDADTIQVSHDFKVGTLSEKFINKASVSVNSTINSACSADIEKSVLSQKLPDKASNMTNIFPSKSNESSEKSNTSKSAPKFGRSKCKPVLSNLAKRKKISPEDNVSVSTDMTSGRTESVIKSVRAEVNSTVLEIKESFASLEEEEEDLTTNIVKSQALLKDQHFDGAKVDDVHNKVLASTVEALPEITEIRTNTVIVDKDNSDINPTDKSALENSIDKSTVSGRVPMSPIRGTAKLVPKPSPRLCDVSARRLSFQGSDSEEELKWKKPYSTSEKDPQSHKSAVDKTFKSNKRKQRAQGSTYSKMGQDTLEKFSKKFGKTELPDKTQLKMIDLIFYNPKSNPMTSKPQTKTLAKKREEKPNEMTDEDVLAEQEVDDVEEAPALPVPQLKIGPDGQIMLDPQSLVIETTGIEKSRAELEKSEVVQETGLTRYNTYSKKRHSRSDWSPQETLQFYKVLNTIGTDFSLMCQLFPKRTRHELKLKFKKEEKTNLQLIDKAMKGSIEFDFESLEESLREEREEMARKKLEKQLADEAAKREKAMKKENKLKEKENKKKGSSNPIDKRKRGRYAAVKDFDEAERKKSVYLKGTHKPPQKKRKSTRKNIIKLETDSSDNCEQEYESEDEGIKLMRMVKQVSSGRIIKPSTKLEEYEEMNENLRKKLDRDSDSPDEDDSYSFLPGAQMLFGEPLAATPDQHPNNNFAIEIQEVPSIEQTIELNSNVEEVSEISELGSFGQNVGALDLSAPVRANITKDMLLNRHIISESIQIIDQLTQDQETSEVVLGSEDVMEDIREILPSFESVERARPPVIYSLQTSYHSENQNPQGDEHSADESKIIMYNPSEECILGD